MTRKQRRLEARQNGVKFVPEYNGNSPSTYKEHYGVGNERFNNKFVDFTVKPAKVEKIESNVVAESTMESVVIDTEEVKSKGLFGKAKKLFSKGKR